MSSPSRRLVTVAASLADVALACRSDAVLRDPAHRTTPNKKNAWAALQKDELVGLGARLRHEATIPTPHVFAGWIVPAKNLGTIGTCVEVAGGSVVNVTLSDPDSHQGHRFTNLSLKRDDFDLVDPDLRNEKNRSEFPDLVSSRHRETPAHGLSGVDCRRPPTSSSASTMPISGMMSGLLRQLQPESHP